MPEAWRISRKKYAHTAFNGEGAATFGGRWNLPGTPMVYTSATLSLAALETLVHLPPATRHQYLAWHIKFPANLIEKISLADLPADWQIHPPGSAVMAIGDAWVKSATSAVLQVPSVIVPHEFNYLLNPHHRHYHRLQIQQPIVFSLDPRLTITTR